MNENAMNSRLFVDVKIEMCLLVMGNYWVKKKKKRGPQEFCRDKMGSWLKKFEYHTVLCTSTSMT